MIYRYDGTFAGLLTLLAELQTPEKQAVDGIERPPFADLGLFDRVEQTPTDVVSAQHLLARIRNRLGSRTLAHLRRAFLAERHGIELHLRRYLDLGWKVGRSLNSYLAHPDVHAVLAWSGRTGREAHRMKGFVRFRELADGTFYAPLRTEANVLPLIARHFAERMDRPWLLHDVQRQLGALGQQGRFTLGTIQAEEMPAMASAERDWQNLWRVFHRTVAIESRQNPALQQQFVPLRYREFLLEFDPPAAPTESASGSRVGSHPASLSVSQSSQ